MDPTPVDLSGVNVVPRRVDDPALAAGILAAEGAVIITGIPPGREAARDLAARVFGDRVLAVPDPAMVREGGEKDRRPDGLDNTVRSRAHTDGYSYGDRYPDYFLLACDHHSEVGGESILLDGYALLDHLAAEPELAWLPDALATRVVDQTEEGKRTSVSTIIQTTPEGRRMLRRTADQVPLASSDDAGADARMIATWKELIDRAADGVEPASRPKVRAGEAIVIDNYRMFHGREPYADPDRLMWRVWVWTDASRGLPEGLLHSDSRYADELPSRSPDLPADLPA